MDINAQTVAKISSYFKPISHIKGRLRVRVDPKITDEIDGLTMADIDSLSSKIDGIKKIKINKIVASVTIEYDNEIFPKKIWDDLLEQQNLEENTKLIEKLYKELM